MDMLTTTDPELGRQLEATHHRIADATINATSLDDLFRAVHKIVAETMSANNFSVALYDQQKGLLSFPYFVDERDTAAPSPQRPGKTATAYVLRTGRPLICRPPADRESKNRKFESNGVSSGVWLGVPLRVRDKIIGIMVAQDYRGATAYGQRELAIMEYISSLVANAIERRREEERLRLQTTALESAANAVLITDLVGTIQWVNPAFTKLTGYKFDEAVGKNPKILQSGKHPPIFYAEMWDRIQQGLIWQGEVINRRKNGDLFTEEMTITPVRNERGELSHFIAIKQDISERQKLEQQLVQAQKMEAVGRLAGGVAHDFNNLLTVILGYSDLLLTESDPAHPSRAKIDHIHKAARQAAELTQQLLAFSRKQMSAPTVLSLNAVVNDTHNLLIRLIGEDIRITTRLNAEPGQVNADRGQIEQVLMNLAVNARDAMPHGGDLIIETADVELDKTFARQHPGARPGPAVMLSVTDSGTGIDKDTQAHIFEPFFTTKDLGKGTGLGLAMVYGIVKQSNGYISVNSEPGQGSTFNVYLPRVQASAEPSRGRTSAPTPRGSETILLVEDAPDVRALTRELLENCGYTVLEAGDPEEAIGLAEGRKNSIALLITDVVMPVMSGAMLANRLMEARPELRVLYVSGYTDDAIVHHRISNSPLSVLAKPFTRDALAIRVREILDLT